MNESPPTPPPSRVIRNFDFDSEKIVILGASGQGKSYLLNQLILSLPADATFIFDHKGQIGPQCGFPFTCRTDAEMDAALNQTGVVVYRPTGNRKKQFNVWLEKVIAVCKQLKGRKRIVFDEGGLILPRKPSSPPFVCRACGFKSKKEKCPQCGGAGSEAEFWHPFQEVQETGREFGIDVACTSQMATHFCPDFRGQFTRIVCFQQSIGWVQPLITDYGDEKFSKAANLHKGEWIAYERDNGAWESGGKRIE